VHISIWLSFTVFPIRKMSSVLYFYLNRDFSKNTDRNTVGLPRYLGSVVAVSLTVVFLMCLCLCFSDCFSQFLGLVADSDRFYVECRFLLGTGLIKILHPYCFLVATTMEGLFSVYTHTCAMKRRGEPQVARFSSYVSSLPRVDLNAKSANDGNLSLFHSHRGSRAFPPGIGPSRNLVLTPLGSLLLFPAWF